LRSTSFWSPELFCNSQLKLKNRREAVKKAWRDWPVILTSLSDFGVIEHGYELPKGKNTTSSSLIRVAVDDDDLDILHGRTQHWWLYRFLRRTWVHNWFMILCTLPWVLYQIWTGYCLPKVIYQLCTFHFESLAEHHHALPLLFALSCIGVLFNNFFGWKQSYFVVRIGAQAVEQAVREIWNAEQEKTSMETVASAPVQTRVGNEGCDTAKKMPSIKKVKYVYICKFVTAALAMNIAALHEEEDENFEVDEDGSAKVDTAAAEAAEKDDLQPMMYKLLRSRTSKAPPNDLRDSVVIKEKTVWQLFEEKQKGVKVEVPGEQKLIDFSGVILAPEVIEIIRALQPNKENEISGAHRHLRKLKHPRTGEFLKLPSADTEKRMYLAADTIAAHMERKARENVAKISHFKPPEKWSETMKEEMPEKAEQARQADGFIARWKQRVLKGFNKPGELMLPLLKHARLIGNLGPVSNMEDAMSVGPLENLMKVCYPHLITKKMTLEECDKAIGALLDDMIKNGLIPESDDYSAMDSSWTIYDRYRLRRIADTVLGPIREHLNMTLRNYDHVIDAEERKKQVKWQLKYITLLMDPKDAILFSGERMTSLMNRWLVLILESAEDIRCLGEEEGIKAINATLDGTRRTTQGDGDDNLQGIIPGRYRNLEERIDRFADMYKLLEPCSAADEKTDAEVLSRFHIWCGKKIGYVHIGKLERNMGRLIAFKIPRSNLHDDATQTALTQKELAMICTDVWQRIISLQSTMVVRHFARAVFVYAYGKLRDQDAGTAYDDDMKRLGREDNDRSLRECLDQINEVLATATTSTWAMVKVAHFKSIKNLKSKQIVQMQEEWQAADQILSMAEIEDKHVLHPTTFFEDFPISSNVAKALGLRKSCIDVAIAREKREKPQSYVDVLPSPLAELGAALLSQNPGELADVASLSSTGSAENTRVDPVSEPEQFDISDGDNTCGICGAEYCSSCGNCGCNGNYPYCSTCDGGYKEEQPSQSSGIGRKGEKKVIAGLPFVYVSDERGWVSDTSDNEFLLEIGESDCEDTGVPRGPSEVESRVGNTKSVKTAGGPKSNLPNMHGGPCSGGVQENDDAVDLEGGLGMPLLPPPGLRRTDTAMARVIAAAAAMPQVLNLTSLLQAPSSVTSRNPREMGRPGGVEQGLARTNCQGQGVNVTERRGNDGLPSQVGVNLEPHSFPKTPTVQSTSVDSRTAGGSRHSHSSIVGRGSKTYGAKQTDKRDRKKNTSQAGRDPHPPATSSAESGSRWKPVRRGTRGKAHDKPGNAPGPERW
jgi:hypothetical protein